MFIQSLERSPFHPWFLEKTSSGLVTVADVQTVALPTDFLLMVEDTKIYLIDSDEVYHEQTRGYHEDMERIYNAADAGTPAGYDIFAGNIYFGPKPDGVYTIRLKYYQRTTPPSDDGVEVSNLWTLNAEDFMVTSLAARLCDIYTMDERRAASLKIESSSLRLELFKYNEARKHTDMDYVVDR